MAKTRETPCLYYICAGQCKKVEKQTTIITANTKKDSKTKQNIVENK